MFKNKIILITGGTGSFGSACAKYLYKNYKPKKTIIFSRDELKQYEMQNFLSRERYDLDKFRFFIGDVRDRSRLNLAFNGVDFVIQAAALKQIPTAEYNPQECINTNINGASNVIFSSLEQGVKKVIAMSTDKASSPINLYGATKLASDKLFVSANSLGGKYSTRFSVVRYGNVLNSRGSVIPFFKKLLEMNKPSLPITDLKMTRFFISLQEGIKFVLESFHRMQGGEIFIPKIPSCYIKDIALALNPNIKLKIIGIRPGEKLHESLCSQAEAHLTLEFKKHYVIEPAIWQPGTNVRTYRVDKRKERGKKVKKDFEYNSFNNKDILKIADIKKLLKKISSS